MERVFTVTKELFSFSVT